MFPDFSFHFKTTLKAWTCFAWYSGFYYLPSFQCPPPSRHNSNPSFHSNQKWSNLSQLGSFSNGVQEIDPMHVIQILLILIFGVNSFLSTELTSSQFLFLFMNATLALFVAIYEQPLSVYFKWPTPNSDSYKELQNIFE